MFEANQFDFVELLDCPLEGAVNTASGRGLSFKYLATEIARELGKEELVGSVKGLKDYQEPDYIIANTARLKKDLD